MRQDFVLPEEDMDFLEEYNGSWETVIEGRHRWLIMHNYPVLFDYNQNEVTLALRIDAGYPTSQIDMVYFNPPLLRNDSKPIGALSNQTLQGMNFQRWSRHRTPQYPWRSGVDNLQTHLLLVNNWLQREFKKR